MRQKKRVRVFCWQIFNATVAAATSYFSGLNGEQAMGLAVFMLPFLNFLTKYINNTFFGDLGVK